MDEEIERKLLISEIRALEAACIKLGEVSFPDVTELVSKDASISELKSIKQRFQTLARSLGPSNRT